MASRTMLLLAGLFAAGAALAQDMPGTATGSTRTASLMGTALPPAESLAVAGMAVVGAAVGLSSDSEGADTTSTSTSTSTATATAP